MLHRTDRTGGHRDADRRDGSDGTMLHGTDRADG